MSDDPELRQQAERMVLGSAVLSPGEAQRMLSELEASRSHYVDLYDRAPVGYCTLGEGGLILEANLTAAELLGMTRNALVQQPISHFIHPEDRDLFDYHRQQLFELGEPQAWELRMLKQDGAAMWTHLAATAERDASGEPLCRLILSEITERKSQQDAQELTARLILRVNTPGDLKECMADLTAALQDWSGCEAVGIRLSAGNDYPYFETRGFPSAFVQLENHLCARDRSGALLCDEAGKPVLECMCGNVLCGRVDPTKPYFTAHGSFWSNGTTALLASTTEAERGEHARNRCNSEGYESVALIPMRSGTQVFGLLQFNDRRPHRFTPDSIARFEQMADSLAMALSQHQIEDALRESEDRYRRITEGLTDYQYRVRVEQGRAVATMHSLGCETVTGYTVEDFAADPYLWFTMIAPEDRETAKVRVEQILAGEQIAPFEHRIVRKDGALRWVMDTSILIKDASGNLLHYDGVVKDITERKQAEAALHRSEAKNLALISAIPDLIFTNRRDGEFLAVHTSDPGVLYVPPEAFLYRRVEEVLPAPFADQFMKAYADALDLNAVQELNYMLPVGGKEMHFEARVAPCAEDMVITIVRDVTERKRAEAEKAEFESQNRQLQKTESLGRMAGAIAHHFNNKLQSIMANLELLGAPTLGVDPVRCLAMAMRATEKAAEVSRLMLLYLGQSTSKREPRYLAELCRESLPLVQDTLPDTVTLETNWPAPGPVISANENEILRVLTNLISNAWEAMGEGRGTIHLSVRSAKAEEIPTEHRFPQGWHALGTDYACLEVRDSGCGIAETEIEKLFDPFYSTKFISRGLGLPVVLGIVHAHDGVVTIESQPGHYCVFRVFFPVSQELPRSPEVGNQTSAPEGGGTVLLVDDDELLLMSTGALIEMLGFTLLTARDGVEAVEMFREYKGDIRCVITDLTMPRMDGWETLAALREINPTLPVILASGYDKGQVLAGAHTERPQAFLGKPFGLQQLRNALGQALAAASPNNQ